MIGLLWFAFALLVSPFRSTARLEAENAVLRQQLIVLGRTCRGRARLTNSDRLFFVQLYRWFPSIIRGPPDHPAGDAHSVASRWVSQLLALEVSRSRRAAPD